MKGHTFKRNLSVEAARELNEWINDNNDQEL